MNATLYIVGTGPGDPQLLTLKAAHVIRNSPVIVAPRGSRNGPSTALSIIEQIVQTGDKTVIQVHFPMKKIKTGREPDPEVRAAWNFAAKQVLHHLERGLDVCFPTLGDPAIYSTGYYLYDTICVIKPDVSVRFVPGIPAMSSCSAVIGEPICLGDEMVAVVPATFSDERLRDILLNFDTIVLMKVHRVLDRLVELLGSIDLLDRSVLVERAGTDEEMAYTSIESIKRPPHYYSTIIVRKNGNGRRPMVHKRSTGSRSNHSAESAFGLTTAVARRSSRI